MFVVSNLITALMEVLEAVFTFLEVAILVRVVLSWADADPMNGLVRAVAAITEPILRPFRKWLPPWRFQGLDLSPLLAMLTILFARKFLLLTLAALASRMS